MRIIEIMTKCPLSEPGDVFDEYDDGANRNGTIGPSWSSLQSRRARPPGST